MLLAEDESEESSSVSDPSGDLCSFDAYTKRVVHTWIDQNGGVLVKIRSRRTNDQRFKGLRKLAFRLNTPVERMLTEINPLITFSIMGGQEGGDNGARNPK